MISLHLVQMLSLLFENDSDRESKSSDVISHEIAITSSIFSV